MRKRALPPTQRRLATIAVASAYVQVHPKTLRRWVSNGELTGFRAGPKLIRIDLDELDEMLNRTIVAGDRDAG